MDSHKAALTLYVGPMFSGKTTQLLSELINASSVTKLRCLYINHTLDTRSEKEFSTHNSMIDEEYVSKRVDMINASTLSEVNVNEYDIIGVDEAQFFDDLNVVLEWVNNKDKHVFVAGLNSNYLRGEFGNVHRLLCQADNVYMLHAFCTKCAEKGKNKKAIHTMRLDADEDNANEPHVGSADMYMSVCRKCYNTSTKVSDTSCA